MEEEFSLEFKKDYFETSRGGISNKGPSKFDGEMRVKQKVTAAFDINVVLETAILDGFGIEPKFDIVKRMTRPKEPLETSLYVISYDIEAQFPKDLSAILAPKTEFESIQMDTFKNVSTLLVNRIKERKESQEIN
jgi:hypothetical protein